jgi:hypothetical protein
MSQGNGIKAADARRDLVERLASSAYLNRSTRLRDLLLYLTDRVLDGEAAEIHEQEVGHNVFGRPADYDTSADNIVRVHASTLRKRLDQYFANEGVDEPLVIEIPKGNYAPVFRERRPAPPPVLASAQNTRQRDWRLWALAGTAVFLALSLILFWSRDAIRSRATERSMSGRFWSQVFQQDRPADVVLDDSAVALYQEITGRALPLSEYFDRSYLRSLTIARPGKMDAETASTMVLRRQSSYAAMSFFWKLLQRPAAGDRKIVLRFARDFSFRDLKSDNAILLGNTSTNPWVQPFESRVGIHWQYDRDAGIYYPVDSWDGGKSYRPGTHADARQGYFSLALLPNLGGAGNILIVSGTGGSALNSGADFLSDNQALAELRSRLPGRSRDPFPYFEALIRMRGRSTLPRDAVVVVCRPAAS